MNDPIESNGEADTGSSLVPCSALVESLDAWGGCYASLTADWKWWHWLCPQKLIWKGFSIGWKSATLHVREFYEPNTD